MPLRANESLDDPHVWDGAEQVAGISTELKASQLAPELAAWMGNMEPSDAMMPRTRQPLVIRKYILPVIEGPPLQFYYSGAVYAATADTERVWFNYSRFCGYIQDLTTLATGFAGFPTLYWPEAAEIFGGVLGTEVVLGGGGVIVRIPAPTLSSTPVILAGAPAAEILEVHTNRAFAAVGDLLYVSDLLDATTWPDPENVLRIGTGDADTITGLKAWRGNLLLVAKRESMWIVDCDPTQPPANWMIERVPGNVGCRDPRTLTRVGNDVWFLASDETVRSVRRMAAQADNEVSEPISTPISRLLRYVIRRGCQPCAIEYRNRFLLTLETRDYGPQTLVYDLRRQQWVGPWTDAAFTYARQWLVTTFGGGVQLILFGGTSVWEFAEEGTPNLVDGEPVPVPSEFVSRGFDFKEVVNPKLGDFVEVEFRNSDARARLFARLDSSGDDTNGADWIELIGSKSSQPGGIPTGTGPSLSVPLPFRLARPGSVRKRFALDRLGPFRHIQFKVTAPSGTLSIQSIACAGWTETYDDVE